jgi:hypothetical protein
MVKLNNLNPPGPQAFTEQPGQTNSQFQQAQTPLNNQQAPKGLFKIPENLLPLIP